MSLAEVRAKKIAMLMEKAVRLLAQASRQKDPVRKAKLEADAAKARAEAIKIQGRK